MLDLKAREIYWRIGNQLGVHQETLRAPVHRTVPSGSDGDSEKMPASGECLILLVPDKDPWIRKVQDGQG